MTITKAKDAIQVTFMGDVDQWDMWIAMFEKRAHNLDERSKLLWFHVSLSGEATESDMKLNCTDSSYDTAKRALEKCIFEVAYNSNKKQDAKSVRHWP